MELLHLLAFFAAMGLFVFFVLGHSHRHFAMINVLVARALGLSTGRAIRGSGGVEPGKRAALPSVLNSKVARGIAQPEQAVAFRARQRARLDGDDSRMGAPAALRRRERPGAWAICHSHAPATSCRYAGPCRAFG